MREEMQLESAHQVKALAHPLRQRVFQLLVERPLTNKQLATLLEMPPAKVHFHVRELVAAGLIHLVEERPKGGVVEKYYRSSARGLRLAPGLGGSLLVSEGLAGAVLASASEELGNAAARSGGPPVGTRVVRVSAHLTHAGLDQVKAHLDAIYEEFGAANDVAAPLRPGDVQLIAFTYALYPIPEPEIDADDNGPPGVES